MGLSRARVLPAFRQVEPGGRREGPWSEGAWQRGRPGRTRSHAATGHQHSAKSQPLSQHGSPVAPRALLVLWLAAASPRTFLCDSPLLPGLILGGSPGNTTYLHSKVIVKSTISNKRYAGRYKDVSRPSLRKPHGWGGTLRRRNVSVSSFAYGCTGRFWHRNWGAGRRGCMPRPPGTGQVTGRGGRCLSHTHGVGEGNLPPF